MVAVAPLLPISQMTTTMMTMKTTTTTTHTEASQEGVMLAGATSIPTASPRFPTQKVAN